MSWWKNNSIFKSNPFTQIALENAQPYKIISGLVKFDIELHVHIPTNKMGLLSGRLGILLIIAYLYLHIVRSLLIFGIMFSQPQFTTLILFLQDLMELHQLRSCFFIKPDYSFFRVFKCEVFPRLCPYNKNKFNFHSISCVFLGYRLFHLGYYCLDYFTNNTTCVQAL